MDALPLCAWLARRALAISAGSLKNWVAILSYKRVKNHPLTVRRYRHAANSGFCSIAITGRFRYLSRSTFIGCGLWSYGHRVGRSGIRCEYIPVRSTKSSLILTIPDRPTRWPQPDTFSDLDTQFARRMLTKWRNLLIYPISFSLCFIGTQPLPVPAGLPPLPSTSTLSSSRKTSRFS